VVEDIGNCKVVRKVGLIIGYYQVEVEESDKEKTAFICAFGKYEFTRTTFGLKKCPCCFSKVSGDLTVGI